MAMRDVVGRVLRTDGTPWESGVVHFRLTPGSFTPTEQFPESQVEALTDATGAFSVSLWTNEEGDKASRYVCRLPNQETFDFTLPLGDGTPIELSTLRALGLVPGQEQHETVLTFIKNQPAFVSGAAWFHNVKAYGATGGGVDDDRAAFVAAEAAGDHGFVPAGTYHIASNLTLTKAWTFAAGARIKPAAGVSITLPTDPQAGRYHIFDISAGGLIRIGSPDEVKVEWFGAVGDNAALNDAAMAAALTVSSEGSRGWTVTLGFGKFRFANTIEISRGIHLKGASGSMWYASTWLRFNDGVVGLKIHRSGTSQDGGAGDWAYIEGLLIEALGKTSATAHGFHAHARFTLRNCEIRSFGGDGVFIDAHSLVNAAHNANCWRVDRVRIYGNAGHGFHVHGNDTNAGLATLLNTVGNMGYQIFDDSFLGNTYIGGHSDSSLGTALGNIRTSGGNNRSVFIGQYDEGGGSPAKHQFTAKTAIFGGTWSHLIDWTYGQPMYFDPQRMEGGSPFRVGNHNSGNGEYTGSQLHIGSGDGSDDYLRFKNPDEIWGLRWRWRASQKEWGMFYQEASFFPFRIIANGHASKQPGFMELPSGFYAGNKKITYGTAAPTSGTHSAGDMVLHTSLGSAQRSISHWFCGGSGTPGTWHCVGNGSGTTAQRPTLTTGDRGFTYFDTTLAKMIYWNGTAWLV